jgi:polyphenol oxidase
MTSSLFIEPNWPAPHSIAAYTTLRKLVSDDTPFNRDSLVKGIPIPSEPIWLKQVHGILAVEACPENRHREADAIFAHQPKQVCVILTGDCLPILLCDRAGKQVAAIHAGWRGLGSGIIESTLASFSINKTRLLAWLGPAISQAHYEVGEEVRELFLKQNKEAKTAFIPSPRGRWLADLYELARMRLKKAGITDIYGGEFCTFGQPDYFYSYRRDGAGFGGRMATFIWIK